MALGEAEVALLTLWSHYYNLLRALAFFNPLAFLPFGLHSILKIFPFFLFLSGSGSVFLLGGGRSKSRTRTVRGGARRTDATLYPGTGVAMPETEGDGRASGERLAKQTKRRTTTKGTDADTPRRTVLPCPMNNAAALLVRAITNCAMKTM